MPRTVIVLAKDGVPVSNQPARMKGRAATADRVPVTDESRTESWRDGLVWFASGH